MTTDLNGVTVDDAGFASDAALCGRWWRYHAHARLVLGIERLPIQRASVAVIPAVLSVMVATRCIQAAAAGEGGDCGDGDGQMRSSGIGGKAAGT